MRKSKRVVIGINRNAVTEKTQKTKELISLIEVTKESIKELTDDNVAESSMEAIDTYLNEKTGFLNGRMSAMAFNREGLYDKVQSLLPKMDSLKDYVQYIKKGAVDEAKIKEDSTSYLYDKYTEPYLEIQKHIEAINKLDSGYVLSNSIVLTRDGLEFNAQKYQSVKAMAKR